MSRDHHPPLRDVTADTESTAFSVVACWTVFTELLPGNALIKSVTLFMEERILTGRKVRKLSGDVLRYEVGEYAGVSR
jgi:hypothetical protein